MMKSLSTILIMALLVNSLSSCAPSLTTAYQLEPVSGDVAMIEGRPVTKAEQNGVSVVASFEREDLDYVTFDIEVKNHTDHPIEVNPANFHFTALGADQDTLTDPANPGITLTGTAADPGYEAGRITLKRKQEEKRLKKAKVFNTLLMVALIASDVSSSVNNRNYSDYVRNGFIHGVGYQGLAVKRAIDYSTFADRMQRYDYEEYRWRELALKTNTIGPGESVRGFVYLPKIPGARYLAVNYTLPELATVPILFKQNLLQEKKARQRR